MNRKGRPAVDNRRLHDKRRINGIGFGISDVGFTKGGCLNGIDGCKIVSLGKKMVDQCLCVMGC
jgi:hypothetical protein